MPADGGGERQKRSEREIKERHEVGKAELSLRVCLSIVTTHLAAGWRLT